MMAGWGSCLEGFNEDHYHAGALYLEQLQEYGPAMESQMVERGDILYEVDGVNSHRRSTEWMDPGQDSRASGFVGLACAQAARRQRKRRGNRSAPCHLHFHYCAEELGTWKCGFHDCVGILKALKAVSQAGALTVESEVIAEACTTAGSPVRG
jgi:hypothetical protein